jgi:hypothetical protein
MISTRVQSESEEVYTKFHFAKKKNGKINFYVESK